MKIAYFSIEREYEIKCKSFMPDKNDVQIILVGVHGFAGDKESSMLEKLANSVTANGTALVCFDFPAHGTSPVKEEQFTVSNCKEDLCAVVDFVKEQYPHAKICVVATSFGGYITLLCAEKLSGVPLILRAPAIRMPEVLLKNVLQISAETFRTKETVACGFERPLQLPYRFYEELSLQDNLMEKNIPQPLFIVHGDKDDIVPVTDSIAFQRAHQQTKLAVIQGADHRFKQVGEMEEVLLAIKEFLKSLSVY